MYDRLRGLNSEVRQGALWTCEIGILLRTSGLEAPYDEWDDALHQQWSDFTDELPSNFLRGGAALHQKKRIKTMSLACDGTLLRKGQVCVGRNGCRADGGGGTYTVCDKPAHPGSEQWTTVTINYNTSTLHALSIYRLFALEFTRL